MLEMFSDFMEFSNIQVVINILENLKIINTMGMELLHGKAEIYIEVNIKMEKDTVKVLIIIKVEINT